MISKLLSAFLIKNVKTGAPSYTLTIFLYGAVIVNLKLLISGVEILHSYRMSEFSGVDYAAAMAALGAIHVGNKSVAKNKDDKKDA